MEAADFLEKQKHNNTRMEVFVRLAKLEAANADLTKSLATVQWNPEVEVNLFCSSSTPFEAATGQKYL
ncbi:unnamed protein product [Prunus armeniaca]|uniref:Uncharacterized protein n=1 Tax=Prunus armeniaca TaxID=36596 RepID=A0A6J5XB60_PRUAR|nr:unnamed protein product [Prunus armeniaca]